MLKTINVFSGATLDCEKQFLGVSQTSCPFLFRFSVPWTVHVSALVYRFIVLAASPKYDHPS